MIVSKVNTKLIYKHNNRFEGKHYLNNSSYLSLQLEKNEKQCCALSSLAEVFNPPVFKRQFCKNTPRAVPYFQSSDVQSASERSAVYIYKGQAQSLNLLVKENDILVTGFGTIGNTRLVSKFQNGVCYANNVCRIRTTEHTGFIYAFISGKYGKAQLNTNASGSVVRYIESPGIKKILVPIFSETFQQDVDNLVQEATRLREKAIDELKEAHKMIEQMFDNVSKTKKNNVSIRSILSSHNKRFEAFYHVSENRSVYNFIIENFKYKTLGELTSRIFRPGIFKREYVTNGITFLGGADILMTIPNSEKKLSFRQVKNMPTLTIKKDWILVTCGGTIGNTVLVDNQLEKCVVSQHVMRVVPKDDVKKGYIYALLSSRVGKELITLFSTGSVIPQIEAQHLEMVPIPMLENDVMNRIDRLVSSYISKNEVSKDKERKAIRMVEQEIEKWNKH